MPRPTLVVWGLLVALLLSFPLTCLAATNQVRPIRSVKIIDRDEAGLPVRFPASLAYDPIEDEVYVASPLKNKLVLLTADYFPYLSIGPGRGLESISGSFIKNGNLYVCIGASPKEPRPHIAIYDSAFLPQKKIYFPELENFAPLDLVIGASGNFYIVGFNGTGVVVLDPDGNYLRMIEPRDEVLGVKEKAPILALDVGQDGNLYFVSESMGRVYVYDKNERYLYKFGEKGGEAGKLSRPRGIAVDDFRRQVYLVDYQRHTVPVYAMTGEYLFEIGGMGEGRGWFYYPNDVLVDGRGRILVADTFNHRIQVFEFVGGPAPVFGRPDELLAGAAPSPDESLSPVPEPDVVAIAHIDVELPAAAVGDYLVLTAISREAAAAQQIAQQLSADGLPVHIVPLDKGARGTWQQVLVGPYEDPLEAWQVADMLRSEEQLPAILKTRGAATDLRLPLAAVEPVAQPQGVAASSVAAAQPIIELPVALATAADLSGVPGAAAGASAPLVAADVAIPREGDYQQYRFPTVEDILEGEPADFKMPADEIHRSFHGMPFPAQPESPNPAGVPEAVEPPPGQSPDQTSVEPNPAVIDNVAVAPVVAAAAAPAAAVRVDKELAAQVQRVAANVKQRSAKAAATVDFCVACHDQRIAKVCLQCHPRERRDRM